MHGRTARRRLRRRASHLGLEASLPVAIHTSWLGAVLARHHARAAACTRSGAASTPCIAHGFDKAFAITSSGSNTMNGAMNGLRLSRKSSGVATFIARS